MKSTIHFWGTPSCGNPQIVTVPTESTISASDFRPPRRWSSSWAAWIMQWSLQLAKKLRCLMRNILGIWVFGHVCIGYMDMGMWLNIGYMGISAPQKSECTKKMPLKIMQVVSKTNGIAFGPPKKMCQTFAKTEQPKVQRSQKPCSNVCIIFIYIHTNIYMII